ITEPQAWAMEQLQALKTQGFDTLKIKLGKDLEFEKSFLNKLAETADFKLRGDFNSTLSWQDFENFFKDLPNEKIEYIEDPFPYEVDLWNEARKLVPLALDFEL